MPVTALIHFREDIARAKAIVARASPLPIATSAERLLRSDLLRGAWMFAVGAIDAYFCDAYTNLVAATLISKSRHAPMILPGFFYDIKLPVRAVLESYAVNENLEMAHGGEEDDGASECDKPTTNPEAL